MTARHWPRWSELEGLLRPRRVPLNSTERRLAGAASIADLRLLARRRAPRAVFDYTDGGAGEEVSLLRSRQAYARVEFNPTVLRDVSVGHVDDDPRETGGGTNCLRPDRVHPHGAHRG